MEFVALSPVDDVQCLDYDCQTETEQSSSSIVHLSEVHSLYTFIISIIRQYIDHISLNWLFLVYIVAMSEKTDSGMKARVVLQQCLHARLQVKPPDEESEAEWVEVNRGMVIYICFFKGATEDLIPKMVNTLLNVKLCETESGKFTSVLQLPGSVLIVPQATLGGKPKGRGMQYHGNIGKDEGLKLYETFVSLCQSELSSCKNSDILTEVKHGTYGNRQVLKLDTNGPYTHLMEF